MEIDSIENESKTACEEEYGSTPLIESCIGTVDPHLSGLHLSGGSDYPDTKFSGIAFCTLVIWPWW